VTSPAPLEDDDSYVLHLAGPMLTGLQRCKRCGLVLSDETRITDPNHRPGRYRFTKAQLVVVVHVDDDIRLSGPIADLQSLPRTTRHCTPLPTSERSLR